MCCNTGLIGYIVEGIDAFTDTGVVYLDVRPSEELIAFRRDLRDGLRKYCNLCEWDFAEPFEFHTTIAMHQPPEIIRAIINTVKHDQRYSHRMLRATLLKNGKILCEYDFLLKRMLSRQEALNKTFFIRHTFFNLNLTEFINLHSILLRKTHCIGIEFFGKTKISKIIE